MDLRYCDNCGSTVSTDAAPVGTGRFLCRKCQGGGSGSVSDTAHGKSSAGDSPLSFLDESKTPPPPAKEFSIDDGLDLFSNQTITSLKSLPRMGSSSRDSFRGSPKGSFRSGSGSGLAPRSPESDADAVTREHKYPTLNESLTLFSSKTIVARKAKHFGGSETATAIAEFDDAGDAPSATESIVEERLEEDSEVRLSLAPNPDGCAHPAQTATRIQFLCMSCRAKLVVRPVKKTSKMVCPRCSSTMYIYPEGAISTHNEKKDSPSFRMQTGTIVPNLRRSARSGDEEHAPESPDEHATDNQDAALTDDSPPPHDAPEDRLEHSAEDAVDDALGRDSLSESSDAPALEDSEVVRERLKTALGANTFRLKPGDTFSGSQGAEEFDGEDDLDDLPQDADSEAPERTDRAPAHSEGHAEKHAAAASGRKGLQQLTRQGSWGFLLQTLCLGFLLSLPVFLLGALMAPREATAEAANEPSALLRAGEVVRRGLAQLIDQLGEWF